MITQAGPAGTAPVAAADATAQAVPTYVFKFQKGYVVPENSVLVGVPKGMRQLLAERDIDVRELKANCGQTLKRHTDECCVTGVMLHQPDFKAQVCDIAAHIRAQGHLCAFLPKARLGLQLAFPLVSRRVFSLGYVPVARSSIVSSIPSSASGHA